MVASPALVESATNVQRAVMSRWDVCSCRQRLIHVRSDEAIHALRECGSTGQAGGLQLGRMDVHNQDECTTLFDFFSFPLSLNFFASWPAAEYASMGVESRQPGVFAAVITTLAAATVAIVLRFVARRITKVPLWWDDFLCVGAYVRPECDLR
jgi:hypothetical protein